MRNTEGGAMSQPPAEQSQALSPLDLLDRYRAVRQRSEGLCLPLEVEDYVVQSMPDASPIKWHLAHTTWFFETFVLRFASPKAPWFNAAFNYLFNSYYNA